MSSRGQAILELAIFGSLFIMLLGVLINYGLRYNFQQKVIQQAFRQALASAAQSTEDGTPISTSHQVVRDVRIPDSSQPFSIGSLIPVSASASVVRNYKMQETADGVDEYPSLIMDIKGDDSPYYGGVLYPALPSYTTAGYAYFLPLASQIMEEAMKKFKEIYGNGAVDEAPGTTVVYCEVCYELSAYGYTCGTDIPLYDCLSGTGLNPCGSGAYYCPDTYDKTIPGASSVRVMSPLASQIVDYDSAVSLCRKIVDPEVCEADCLKGREWENNDANTIADCENICAQSIQIPELCGGGEWIAGVGLQNNTGAYETNTTNHQWTFDPLETLFAFANEGPKQMGLQADYSQQVEIGVPPSPFSKNVVRVIPEAWDPQPNIFWKEENSSGITTEDDFHQRAQTTRNIVYREQQGTQVAAEASTQGVTTEVYHEGDTTWSTDW